MASLLETIRDMSKEKKNYEGRGNSPYINSRRAVSPLHHEASELKELMGIWRVTGRVRLHRYTRLQGQLSGNTEA
eukprot:1148920-Pelagomonas_calceolata.AAC.6